MKRIIVLFIITRLFSCSENSDHNDSYTEINSINQTAIVVLGTAQDAGHPHVDCKKNCCLTIGNRTDLGSKVSSLGIVDVSTNKIYVIDASPDFTSQLSSLHKFIGPDYTGLVDGIFLTHAHIGHYTGLMYLGKEAKGSDQIPVYAMPRMKLFLEQNGPWSQLVTEKNVLINPLYHNETIFLSEEVQITPFLVPHRDEYSETVGFKIKGPKNTALFIPDIDKWEKWDKNIIEEVKNVDFAFLDATFYSGKELNNRDMNEIPHPFVLESMNIFSTLTKEEKSKIKFIHFNHTNPIIKRDSPESRQVSSEGYGIARQNDIIYL